MSNQIRYNGQPFGHGGTSSPTIGTQLLSYFNKLPISCGEHVQEVVGSGADGGRETGLPIYFNRIVRLGLLFNAVGIALHVVIVVHALRRRNKL